MNGGDRLRQDQFYTAALNSGWTGLGNVRVLNLCTHGHGGKQGYLKQDQLALVVPRPGALLRDSLGLRRRVGSVGVDLGEGRWFVRSLGAVSVAQGPFFIPVLPSSLWPIFRALRRAGHRAAGLWRERAIYLSCAARQSGHSRGR